MGEYHFGVGEGVLTRQKLARLRRAARRFRGDGVTLAVVSGNQGHCMCGYGCRLDTCDYKKWWFSAPNRGEPFDGDLGRRVMAAVGDFCRA